MTRCIYIYVYHIGRRGRRGRREGGKGARIFVVGERRVFYGGGK